MYKKFSILLLCLILACCLIGCCTSHDWVRATCSEPKTCSNCGKTEGTSLGHSWQEADCVNPRTCSICGAAEGTTADHTWAEATCGQPETCQVCGETQGVPLGHMEGETVTEETDYVTATISHNCYCKVCDALLSSDEEGIKTLHNGQLFLMSPNDFWLRYENQLSSFSDGQLTTYQSASEKNYAVFIYDGGYDVTGMLLFLNGEHKIQEGQGDDPLCFSGILGYVTDVDAVAHSMLALILTCDPSLSFDDAKDICLKILDETSMVHNGITYILAYESNSSIYIGASIKK